jgi:hypothetical protein
MKRVAELAGVVAAFLMFPILIKPFLWHIQATEVCLPSGNAGHDNQEQVRSEESRHGPFQKGNVLFFLCLVI